MLVRVYTCIILTSKPETVECQVLIYLALSCSQNVLMLLEDKWCTYFIEY